jgi:ribosomal peptide maturation radical SAM protein 1
VQTVLDDNPAAREGIQGVFSKAHPDGGTCGPAVGEELPLDVPVPLDYDGFFASLDRLFPGVDIDPILLFETSRGCWWGQRAHCTFCGLNGLSMDYRAMQPALARTLIESLFKYSSRVSRLQCVDNIMPRHYPKEVFAALDTPGHMRIFYEVKADLSDEDLQTLSRARVKEVQPGIEALATSTLKLMKKGTTVFQNLRFLANCVMRDVFPCWSLLVGFPGETSEVYRKYVEDIPKLVHLPPPSGVYPVRPDRYSPYHVRAKEYGLELRPADFYDLVYPFTRESIDNLAYFFRDNNFKADYFTAMVEWFDAVRDRVESWRARWDRDRHAVPPELYLAGEGAAATVFDSRSGEMLEHPLGEAGWIALQAIAKPRRRSDVRADLEGRGIAADETLDQLERAGLLFQEGDHVMALVLPRKPSWTEGVDGWSWAA